MPGMTDPERVVEMEGITKQFPGVLANDHVDFAAFRGRVHALVGENGAGKTTLMSILYGLTRPDEGTIRVRGRAVSFSSARDAIACGIGMVHQHFMLVPSYTVAENIILGQEPRRRRLFLDMKTARERVRELSDRYGLAVDPDARIRDLSVGTRQRVEILKLLYRGLDILILDEPTAVLTPQETQGLFATVRALAEDGRTIIFITHKLPEVLAVSDHVTVLRRGRVVGNVRTADVTMKDLATMMVGREISLTVDRTPAAPRGEVLALRGVTAHDNRGVSALKDVSLEVRAGEIVTIAGVEGNGQTELAEVIAGLRPLASGQILIDGHDASRLPPRKRRELGLGFIPEDRMKTGLALEASVEENFIIGRHHSEPFSRRGRLNFRRIREYALELIRDYDVRTPGAQVPAKTLSGGNLQKAVVAREFSRGAKLYVVAQPTRGVDIGSLEFIHRRIVEIRERGAGILLISTDLDEVFSLSDRILVMYGGEITGEFRPDATSREEIGLYMTGTKRMNMKQSTTGVA